MNRRDFVISGTALAFLPITVSAQASQIDVSSYIDTGNPQGHCNQDHQHDPLPMDINPVEQLDWSAGDSGFNEGAAAGVTLLLNRGIGLPPVVANLGGAVAGNVWKRVDMMNFAKALAKSGNVPVGVGLAILSQWHNCHAYRTLINNVPAVTSWLLA